MSFALSSCGSQNDGNDTANTRSDSESVETFDEASTEVAGTGDWLEGIRFSSGVSEADVWTGLKGLGF